MTKLYKYMLYVATALCTVHKMFMKYSIKEQLFL